MTTPEQANASPCDPREKLLAWLDAQIEVCEAAWPGPWRTFPERFGRGGDYDMAGIDGGGRLLVWLPPGGPPVKPLGAFIAAARTFAPAVLSAYRREIERHQQIGNYRPYCSMDSMPWPCPTITDGLASCGLSEPSR